jgi:exopolyphosphatase/guanosine-5'-triphosphate,3'-diphosphate pyrophosphatase
MSGSARLPSESTGNYTPKNGFLEFGSTSIKFYLVALAGERAGEVEEEIKIPWDLGFEVFMHQRISPSSIAFCLETLDGLQRRFPEIAFEGITAIGTSALREAQNVEFFRRLLKEKLGFNLAIIEGGIEAFLLENGFRDSVTEFPTGLFDLGGGSLELVEYLSEHSTRKTCLPIGAIRLHCLLRRQRGIFDYIHAGRKLVLETIQRHLDEVPRFQDLIGTGGTVRAIVQALKKDVFTLEDIQGLIQEEVHGKPQRDLPPHRRRVFLPGLIILECLYPALGVDAIAYRSASVKGGLISLMRLMPMPGGV